MVHPRIRPRPGPHGHGSIETADIYNTPGQAQPHRRQIGAVGAAASRSRGRWWARGHGKQQRRRPLLPRFRPFRFQVPAHARNMDDGSIVVDGRSEARSTVVLVVPFPLFRGNAGGGRVDTIHVATAIYLTGSDRANPRPRSLNFTRFTVTSNL